MIDYSMHYVPGIVLWKGMCFIRLERNIDVLDVERYDEKNTLHR